MLSSACPRLASGSGSGSLLSHLRRSLATTHGAAPGGKAAASAAATAADSSSSSSSGSLEAVDLKYDLIESKVNPSPKTPIIIHHSLMGSRKNWCQVAREIDHITRRTVVSLDARNHGQSPHTPQMSYSLMAKDCSKLIRKLEMDKVSFIGHSMGGRVGMILALTEPQRFDRLVVVDSSTKNTEASSVRWETLRKACLKLTEMEAELRKEEGITRTMLADKAIREILPNARDRSLFLVNLLKTPTGTKTDKLWQLNIDAIMGTPSFEMPSLEGLKFEGETLFIGGEHSKFVKKEDEEHIRKFFPNAQVHIEPECGHWIQTEKHHEFMSQLMPFLERPAG